MNMRKLNLLIPSVNRPTHPSLIKCLRNNGEREVRIVGVDMVKDGIGPHISDIFYQVPARKAPSFLGAILEICRKESIDVYYALGEEEAISAAKNRASFQEIGTEVITPGEPEMLVIATNKCLWHNYFARCGIPHADYRIIDSFEKISHAASELGYPDNDIMIKPAEAKGGRGARIVTARDLSEDYYSDNSSQLKLSLESLKGLLAPLQNGRFKPLLAMEYLPGTFYSVDVLSKNGQVIYAVPKIRLEGSASNSTLAQVDLNPDAIALASQACAAFKFSYLQNYEMKLNSEGQPRIYDINPRGGASLVLCAHAGVNIAYFAVKMAVGEALPQVEIKKNMKMIRYYDEYFIPAP